MSFCIYNGRIIDGTGAPPFDGYITTKGGKIDSVVNSNSGSKPQVQTDYYIDVEGSFITPGFIDIHRHGDFELFREGFGELELKQGLTTVINGNCGLSVAPTLTKNKHDILEYLYPITGAADTLATESIGAYLSAAEEQAIPVNAGMLVGSGTIRAAVADYQSKYMTKELLDRARDMVAVSLKEGALGVSLGLGYCPEAFYNASELIYVLEPLKGTKLPLTVHMRGEGDTVCESIEEMLTVGRALKSPLHISHLKAIGRANWGSAIKRALAIMDAAKKEGVDVSYDVYPYTAGSTQLIHCLPPDMLEGGIAKLVERLKDRNERDILTNRLASGTDFDNIVRLVGLSNIVMSSLNVPSNKKYEGMRVTEIGKLKGQDPYECLYDMLIEENCQITMVDYITDEQDIIHVMKSPLANIISDSTYPTNGIPHPRVYGTFSRVLEHFVRELKVMKLEEAVYKMTARPASLMNLSSKGRLMKGLDADINVFRLDAIHEKATYQNPRQMSEGIAYSFVNGVETIEKGRFTGNKPGKIIRSAE